MTLPDNGRIILLARYARIKENGDKETPEEVFARVARFVAGGDEALAAQFEGMMAGLYFLPNSPTFTGTGTKLGQLAACFVLPISDDMGRNKSGIFQTLRDAALVQQTGGGNGFSFSRLRPAASLVKSSQGKATGPVGFLRVYDQAFGEIAQGGSRRGANMAVLRVDHLDVEPFITCKTDEHAITNFNISVGILDAFMAAIEADGDWDLRFPDVEDPKYRGFDGTLEQAEAKGIPIKVYKTVRARELFEMIVKHAHHNGEPGVLFLDAANRTNPVGALYPLEATNPCGEQWLGPYESCCLGSINLVRHMKDEAIDWDHLERTTRYAVIFLDLVIDRNNFVPAVPQLKEMAEANRRIGLGIMGLADVLFQLGVPYASEEGRHLASNIMEFIRYIAMDESAKMAELKGALPNFRKSVYPKGHWDTPPMRGNPGKWGRPQLDWETLKKQAKKDIRHAAITTIAPTGTLSTVAGVEGYGCEPAFSLSYTRVVRGDTDDDNVVLTYVSEAFENAVRGLPNAEQIIDEVARGGSCQHIAGLPDDIKAVFKTSGEISPEEHVLMQAALQETVDNSISKTINMPNEATEEDVAAVYRLAWENACKGLTVYRSGSREKEVLTSADTKIAPPPEEDEVAMFSGGKRSHPDCLSGKTYRTKSTLSDMFVTVNSDLAGPFEVFISSAKAGSEVAAIAEGFGRLISLILRMQSNLVPAKCLQMVIDQLVGIGGDNAFGFGPNKIRSVPDALGKILRNAVADTSGGDDGLELSAGPSWTEEDAELVLVPVPADISADRGIMF